jgi:hypothetical protein
MPDAKRIALKLAGSIAPSLNANRANTELAAKPINARSVQSNVCFIIHLYG